MFTRAVVKNIPRIGQRFLQTVSTSKYESKTVHLEPITLKPLNIANLSKCDDKLFEYQFAALNINNGNIIPPSIQPPAPKQRIDEPGKDERKNIDTPVSIIVNEIIDRISENKGDLDCPPLEGQNDFIEAAVMIEIRRLKMKRHRYRKFLKKFKFEIAKRKLARRKKNEKIFQAELLAKINAAENFSAEKYVTDKLSKMKHVPKPKPEIVSIF
ncbi:uncharacterized protein LOC116339602 [Contarinia nasturtii]|uniref:uncharacterized protein LOC116339602 n=1 Tax=Contarinia nasturtii TaxID=265458 RepID=UPI0012D3A179|nr:uncharacterized protein LOC116339602 [Contarinia nasturtii]